MPREFQDEDDLPVDMTVDDGEEDFVPATRDMQRLQPPENPLLYREPEPATIRVRRAGSTREQPPPAPGVEDWDFGRLFATFQVNWNATAPHYVLGRRTRRALLIGWNVDDLKSVESTSRMYQDIARKCPGPPARDEHGDILVGARICPCEARYNADPAVWEGLPCPAENLQAFRHFTQLIRDLEVRAENYVDVQQVIEIVKLMIYEARCDQELQDEGRMFDLQVGQLNQTTGMAYYNKVTPVSLITQAQLAARREKIYKSLVASREARSDSRRKDVKAAAALGNAGANQNMVGLMTRLNQRNILQRRTIQIEDAASVSRAVTDVDDADIVDDEVPQEVDPMSASRGVVELTDIAE